MNSICLVIPGGNYHFYLLTYYMRNTNGNTHCNLSFQISDFFFLFLGRSVLLWGINDSQTTEPKVLRSKSKLLLCVTH